MRHLTFCVCAKVYRTKKDGFEFSRHLSYREISDLINALFYYISSVANLCSCGQFLSAVSVYFKNIWPASPQWRVGGNGRRGGRNLLFFSGISKRHLCQHNCLKYAKVPPLISTSLNGHENCRVFFHEQAMLQDDMLPISYFKRNSSLSEIQRHVLVFAQRLIYSIIKWSRHCRKPRYKKKCLKT